MINEELSNEFPVEPLSNHIKVQGGYAFKSNEYINEGVPVIRISDFQDERIDLSTVRFYKDDKAYDKFQLFAGDIIIAMTGGTIGKLAIVQDGLGKLYLNQRVGKLSVINENEFEPEYVYWLARGIQNKVKNLGYGGAQPNVSNGQIETLEFPFPNKKIQLKIVEFLNDFKGNKLKDNVYFNEDVEQKIKKYQTAGVNIFTVLEECSIQQTYLQQLRQSILQEAVQGKLSEPGFLRLKDDRISHSSANKILASSNPANPGSDNESAAALLERIKAEKQQLNAAGKLKKEKPLPPITAEKIPFQLPDGWVWCRLGEIINLMSGVTLGKTYKEQLTRVPYLRVANVQRGYVDVTNVKELFVPKSEIDKYSLKEGDLVMIEGGDWDKVGRCAIWNGSIDPCIHQNHIFRLRFYGNIDNKWAELFLNSPVARRYFESCSKQTTNLASINKTQLTNALFPLPPLTEQQRIVVKVQQLMQMVNQLAQQVQQSQTQAQQILQAVLKEAFSSNANTYEENELITMAAEE
ncbi:MAG TPA: restriction endonuclease subunit S [Panacibacter sp.]|nr:restriction endonuclease subunit S [Panacibacter sp.]